MSFVTSYLMGGLGNQMFQIAHAINHAKRLSIDCFFDKNSFLPLQGKKTFEYENNIFKKIKFVDEINVPLMRLYEADIIDRNLENLLLNYNVEFFGYFQSNIFFQDYEDYIKEIFSPTEDFINEAYTRYNFINNNTVSLHIRRGDYLLFPNAHPTIDESYINAALKYCEDYENLLIFTDDKEWANSLNLRNSFIVEGQEDYEDLWLMSLCKDNIISNSSFSWWGSFLNKNPDKKIIVPSLWVGPEGPNMDKIYNDNFIKIPVTYSKGSFTYNNT